MVGITPHLGGMGIIVLPRSVAAIINEMTTWCGLAGYLQTHDRTLLPSEIKAGAERSRDLPKPEVGSEEMAGRTAVYDILYRQIMDAEWGILRPNAPLPSQALDKMCSILLGFCLAESRHTPKLYADAFEAGFNRNGYSGLTANSLRKLLMSASFINDTAAGLGVQEMLSRRRRWDLRPASKPGSEPHTQHRLSRMTYDEAVQILDLQQQLCAGYPPLLLRRAAEGYAALPTRLRGVLLLVLARDRGDHRASADALRRLGGSVAGDIMSQMTEAPMLQAASAYARLAPPSAEVAEGLAKYIRMTRLSTFTPSARASLLRDASLMEVPALASAVQEFLEEGDGPADGGVTPLSLSGRAEALLLRLRSAAARRRTVSHPEVAPALEEAARLAAEPAILLRTIGSLLSLVGQLGGNIAPFAPILQARSDAGGPLLATFARVFGSQALQYPEAALSVLTQVDDAMCAAAPTSDAALRKLRIDLPLLRALVCGMYRFQAVAPQWRPRFQFGSVTVALLVDGANIEAAMEDCCMIIAALQKAGAAHHGLYHGIAEFCIDDLSIPLPFVVRVLRGFLRTCGKKGPLLRDYANEWNRSNIDSLLRLVVFRYAAPFPSAKEVRQQEAALPDVVTSLLEAEFALQEWGPVLARLEALAPCNVSGLYSHHKAMLLLSSLTLSGWVPKAPLITACPAVELPPQVGQAEGLFAALEAVVVEGPFTYGQFLSSAILVCKRLQQCGYGGRHGLLLKLYFIFTQSKLHMKVSNKEMMFDILKTAGVPPTKKLKAIAEAVSAERGDKLSEAGLYYAR